MTTNLRPILKNKYYLYLTEFFAGVSVMAVELGASRLLAPYFSSSQIVWTIIIGTIMIAMALGNLWGGRTADKDPNTDRLYRRILVAAVWIAAIPVVGKYIILGISGLLVLTINTNFLIVAAFCTCMVLFVFPLFLLGTVPFGEEINRKLMRDFRLYMLVGGMPQAVDEYIKTNNFRKVDDVKRDILNLYEDDFKKIDATGKISMLFDAIPAQLNKNASRYQVSSVLTNNRADNTLELIAELKDSKTVLVSYHANDPSAGMSTNKDLTRFKLFLCDTGLFTTLMFKDKDFTENIIYEKLLNDKLGTNLGYLYENVVAQLLTCNGNELFYYTFFNESSRHNYEIDFLIAQKNKVCPIEVKSSGYKTHKSLDEFSIKF